MPPLRYPLPGQAAWPPLCQLYGAGAVAAFVSTVRGAPWPPLCQLYGARRGRPRGNCRGGTPWPPLVSMQLVTDGKAEDAGEVKYGSEAHDLLELLQLIARHNDLISRYEVGVVRSLAFVDR